MSQKTSVLIRLISEIIRLRSSTRRGLGQKDR